MEEKADLKIYLNGKEVPNWTATDDGMKAGARNSRKDAERLQMIHDYAKENGAACTLTTARKAAVKAVSDAPNLRGDDSRGCQNCAFYKPMPASEVYVYGNMGSAEGGMPQGICGKFDFISSPEWVCDAWQDLYVSEAVEAVKATDATSFKVIGLEAAKATGLDFTSTPYNTPPLAIKIAGDMELDVCYMPYGGQRGGKDADGQYFSPRTKEHADKFPRPLVLYYHGYEARGVQQPMPVEIGTSTGLKWEDKAGRWLRVKLDGAIEKAVKVWESAQKGNARASSDSIAHLVRTNPDGEIINWPFVGISLFETETGKKPANSFAFALPAAKALGLAWEDDEPDNDLQIVTAAIIAAMQKK